MAILFVAFATEASRPRKIKKGNARRLPPPAMVLMNPAQIPMANVAIIKYRGMKGVPPCRIGITTREFYHRTIL
jgi:hypothetical protein